MSAEDKKIDKSFDWQLMKRLFTYTKAYIPLLLLTVVLILVGTVVDIARPYLIKVVIDDYISYDEVYATPDPDGDLIIDGVSYDLKDRTLSDILNNDPGYLIKDQVLYLENQQEITLDEAEMDMLRDEVKAGAMFWAAIFFVLLSSGFVANYFQVITLNYVGQRVIYHIRSALFSHVERLSLSFYEKNPVGRLVTRVTNDMNNINELYTNVIVTFLKDLLIIFGSIAAMFLMDFKLALASMVSVPLLLVSAVVFRRQARAAYRVVRVKLARINATLSENITGMKIIQIFNQEERIMEEFEDINNEHLEASLREVKIFAIFRPSMNLLYSLSLSVVIVYGGYRVLNGDLEFGVIIAFTTYIKQFFRPIFDLTEKFNIMQSAMASMERIFLLLDEEEDIVNAKDAKEVSTLKGAVEFKNVCFAYKEDEPVIKDISFSVKPGETIAFVGATGSGKTTIMNLITRMYDIQSGQILIDGQEIKSYDKYTLRRKIIPVLQDVFIFSGRLDQNIRLLDEEITDEEIIEAAEYVNASRFINKLPAGFKHKVTERGATFSQGERQLLSFARALVHNPDILILDEATANIDTETELLIQDAIEKLIKDRTTFVVAHRLSTIKNADKIIVMHKGHIKEMGTHEELLKNRDIYYKLYELQYQ